MDPAVHVMPLVVDAVDKKRFEELRQFIVRSLEAVHQVGGRLDLVVLFGGKVPNCSPYATSAQLIEAIQEECINAEAFDFPLMIPVPGPGDVCPIPSGHMLADTLVRRWGEVSQRVWEGEHEDVVEALEQKVFADYLAWQRPIVAELPEWHQGLLPGEGSFGFVAEKCRVGLVVVNSVFRGIGTKLTHDQVVLSGEQLRHAVKERWEDWVAGNALTLVASGTSTPPPRMLDARFPTLLLSGGSIRTENSSKRTWFVADSGRPACLKVQFGSNGTPVIEDLAKRTKKSTFALLSPVSTSTSTPFSVLTEDQDDAQVLSDFYRQVESGQMIAVLVSGLPGGGEVVDLDTLGRQLAEDVFGQLPQPEPAMDEIWSAAQVHLPPGRLESRLEGLRGDSDSAYPDLHRVLCSPWWWVYDFSASGALKKLGAGGHLKSTLLLTDALTEQPGARRSVCEVTAMNGSFDGNLSSVDFSAPAVDTPSARALWFNRFKAEIMYHPVVFFATSAGSAALWNVLSSLNVSSGASNYPRFIVAPEARLSERARIRHSGLRHIKETPTSFSASRLLPGNQSVEQGKRRLAELLTIRESGTGISLVSAMIAKMRRGSKKFLEGNEPEWGDITGNFAADLSVANRVFEEVRKFGDDGQGIVLLRGAAGSGKTTTLMQCAYRLQQKGSVVGWVDRSATKSLTMIRAEALDLKLDAIFVDDVDIFGSEAASLLRELRAGGNTLVVAAVRNTKLDFVPSALRAADVSADDPLSDDDLRSLIKVLKKHGRLGVLTEHRWPPTRLDVLRRMCERSLLAAMIQVVTGQLFEDKVRSEFEQLDDAQALVYATICVLESAEVFKRRGIELVDLLQIVSPGMPSVRMKDAIASLVRMHLIVRAANGMVRCRQRAIADTVIGVVLKKRTALLGEVMKSLLRFYAGYAGHIDDRNNPYRRTMVRLLNHALMIEFRLPDEVVREIYDSVLDFLQYDFHYWLQRGEFELQRNYLGVAVNYFQSARGCGGEGDYKVDTGWASVTFRRSAEDPSDSSKVATAITALKTLDGVCRTRGDSSEHSFVVMVRVGTEWLEKVYTVLLERDFAAAVSTIRGITELGRKICLESLQFDRAVREYEPRLSRLIERNRGVPT